MFKKNNNIRILWPIIAGIIILIIALIIKGDQEHKLTAEEIAAAETTARLKAGRSESIVNDTEDVTGRFYWMDADNADLPDSGADREEEEVTDATDSTNRFIDEDPEVYEDYQAEEEPEEEVYQAPDKWQDGSYQFTSDEIWEMTRIVYLENGIVEESTDETIYLTACVILNRLYDWEECGTIYEVIWEPGQYSTADRYHDYDGSDLGTSNPDGWQRSKDAVSRAIDDTDRNPHFQSTSAQGEVYYVDPNTGEVFCY